MKTDPNRLTAIEYEEIYHVLNDYCLTALRGRNPPAYTLEVRRGRAKRIRKIMDKMEARMREFPPDFAC